MNPFHPKYQSCSFQDFRIEEVLSRSTNGSVFLGKHQLFNQKFILKEKVVSELGRKKSVLHEVRILRDLKHPNLITCYGYFWKSSRETRRNLVMILRYYEKGDLSMMIERRSNHGKFFSEYEVLLTLYQICQGLKYLHEKGVIHRDIKSSNVFISKKNEVVIGDLGISRKLNAKNKEELIRTFSAGTPIYMSPEVIRNRPYDARTDIWSLGILVWEMMTHKFPFESHQIQDLLGKICHSKPGGDQHGKTVQEIRSRYSDELIKLCLSMLEKDYFHRPKSSQVLESVIELLSKYQKDNSSEKLGPRMKIQNGEPYLTTSAIGKRKSPHHSKRKKNVNRIHQFQRGNYHDFHENRKILLKDFELSTPMKRLHVKKKKKRNRRSSRKGHLGEGGRMRRRRRRRRIKRSSSDDEEDSDDGSSRKSTTSNGSGIWVPVKRTMNRVKEKKMMNLQKEHEKYNGYFAKKAGKKQFLERKFMGEMSDRERRYMERKEKFLESQGTDSSSSRSLVSDDYFDAAAGGGRRKDRVRKKRDPRKRDYEYDDEIENVSDIIYNKVTQEEEDEEEEEEENDDEPNDEMKRRGRRRKRRRKKKKRGMGGGKKRFVENFHRDPINFSLKTFMGEKNERNEVVANNKKKNKHKNKMFLEDPRAYQRVYIQPISKQGWTGNLKKAEKEGIRQRRKRWEEIRIRRRKEKKERNMVSKSLDLEKNKRKKKKSRNRNVLARSANLTVESSRLFGNDEIVVRDDKFWSHEPEEERRRRGEKKSMRRRKGKNKTKKKKKIRKDNGGEEQNIQKNNYFEDSEEEEELSEQQRKRTRNFEKRRRRRRGKRRRKRVFSSGEEEDDDDHFISSHEEEEETIKTSEETDSSNSSSSSSEVETGEEEEEEEEENEGEEEMEIGDSEVHEKKEGQEILDVGDKKSYKRYNPIFGTWETIYV